jgi:hypothetical protein
MPITAHAQGETSLMPIIALILLHLGMLRNQDLQILNVPLNPEDAVHQINDTQADRACSEGWTAREAVQLELYYV